MEEKMKTGHKGDLSELIFLTALLRANREVALPYGNRPGYDVLVRGRGPAWKRVQVKTAYERSARSANTYCDFLRGSGKGKRRKYTVSDLDYLVAVNQSTGEFWVFDAVDVEGKRCRTVTALDDEYMDLERI